MIRVLSLNPPARLKAPEPTAVPPPAHQGADISATARAVMRATAAQIAELAPDVIALQGR